tara:strand:- start:440 stop:649 length:210 start_codon:yes stop_codon:yes gene_type:complete
MTQSQTKKIRKHLEKGRSISPLDALLNYGCFRLAARIYDLKKEGMNIEKYTDYLLPDKNKIVTFYKLAS